MAWLERHFQERMVELLQRQRTEAGLQVEAADAAYRGGRGAQADVFAARLAAALIDDRLRLAAQQVEATTIRLARWVGPDAQQPLGERPSLTTVPAAVHDLDAHPSQHPEIALLARQQTIAQADADLARRNQRPDWSVELMLSQRGPAYANMVSVGVSIPLQIETRNRQDRELAARLAVVEQARAQHEEATREHLAETRLRLLAWQGNQARLTHYDRTLMPLAADYRIEQRHLLAIVDGCQMDLEQTRYLDFVALQRYCHLVAGIVGEVAAQIFGQTSTDTTAYAHRLGLALQLTNIIRDVGEDAMRGRIYLPVNELQQFDVKAHEILKRQESDEFRQRFVALMRFQAERAHRCYDEALAMLPALDRRSQKPGLMMGSIYRDLLREIERDDFRVLRQRVSLTPLRKLWLAWRVQALGRL